MSRGLSEIVRIAFFLWIEIIKQATFASLAKVACTVVYNVFLRNLKSTASAS